MTGRMRARDAGIVIGRLEPGPLNAISDVAGVAVGHVTLQSGPTLNTGVTAILPHEGDLFESRVPAGVVVGNGYGKFIGLSQVEELGELETPLALTNTLSAPQVAAGIVGWTLARPGAERIRSVNPVVGETNDGVLNDIRARAVSEDHLHHAIAAAVAGGPVAEGAVGAGTGTMAFGWKGGIGTASRRLGQGAGGWTVGALVQSNYGGVLTIAGVPVGAELAPPAAEGSGDGSVVVVVATDAPLSALGLTRLARRALFGIARTGSVMAHGSGDYALAFSTAESARRPRRPKGGLHRLEEIAGERMTPLFEAAVEATEEAVLNSLFMATTTVGHRGVAAALPIPETLAILRRRGALA